jgi:hypothetical protein
MISPNEQEPVLDLETSCQIELGRIPAGDSVLLDAPDDTVVLEPQGSRNRSVQRELLQNRFPDES